MSLSPQQLEQRASGITGTDIGAICGFSPWKRPIDVWREKTGRAAVFLGNERTKWGTILERPIREDYEARHDVSVEVPGTLTHEDKPWWVGSPDGLVYRRGTIRADRGLEIKVHGRDAIVSGNLTYGAPGSDEIPAHELAQDLWYMGITGLDRWDHVVFLDGAPVEYVVDRDDDLIYELGERARQFLVDYVEKDEPPPIDGSDSWDSWLRYRWKTNTEDYEDVTGNELVMGLIGELRGARLKLENVEEVYETARQRIKEIIGERAGLLWHDPRYKTPRRIHWKYSKPETVYDYESAFKQVRDVARLLVSARGDAFTQAIEIIKSAPEGSTISDGKTKMPTTAVVELLEGADQALHDIAHAITTSREVPGPRVFNVPRSWGKEAKEG